MSFVFKCNPNLSLEISDVRFVSKVGQIGPKWDISGTFSDHISVHFGSLNWPLMGKSGNFSEQISVHFGSLNQNVLKSNLKKYRICPILGHSDPFWNQIFNPCNVSTLSHSVSSVRNCYTALDYLCPVLDFYQNFTHNLSKLHLFHTSVY